MTAVLLWKALPGRRLEGKAGPESGTMEGEPLSEEFALDPAARAQFARVELVPEEFVIDPAGRAPAKPVTPTEDKVVRAASLLL